MITLYAEPVWSPDYATPRTFVYCIDVFRRHGKWALVKGGFRVGTADTKAEATKWFKENR